MSEIKVTTEPTTIEDIFAFIDDSSIGKIDAHELKLMIAEVVQTEKRKSMERIVERLEEERKGYICDEDDYCEGAYNAYGSAIATVKEEGGIE